METVDKFGFIAEQLAQRRQAHLLRTVQPFEPQGAVVGKRGDGLRHGSLNREIVNFSSNDYLGLSKHPRLIAVAQDYMQRYGTSAAASRLVTGTYPIHQQLEQQLAVALGVESALLFSSGFQANSTILPALVDSSSVVVCDRQIHNSMVQGMLASRARFIRYRHNDLAHLEQVLQTVSQQNYNRILIASETVFSMDGDRSDVDALVDLAHHYNAILYLDDAHALGVFGKDGLGLAAHHPGVDILIGTFGKAFGAFGAFVGCSQTVREYLINYCPGFIYTTALPPAVIGAISAALELIPTLEGDRQRLNQHADHLRTALHSIGGNTGHSSSQIVPLIVGDEETTLQLSHWLDQHGLLATAIRPPTVAKGTARIRFALSSYHTPDQIDTLVHAIRDWQTHDPTN